MTLREMICLVCVRLGLSAEETSAALKYAPKLNARGYRRALAVYSCIVRSYK